MLGLVSGLTDTFIGSAVVVLVAIFGATYRAGTQVGKLNETSKVLTQAVADNTEELRKQGVTIAQHSTDIARLKDVTGMK